MESTRAPAELRVEPEEAGRRLDVFLAERLQLSRAASRRLLARGVVRLEGRTLAARAKGIALRAGECVEIADEGDAGVAPEPELPLVLLASGAGWLAVDKPAGMAVHPLAPGERGTLLGAALARHPEIDGVGEEGALRSGVVHRLDVDTSGVLLLATHDEGWRRLRDAFRTHRVSKTYRAIATGSVEADGEVELPLVTARHRPAFVRAARPGEREGARVTRTRWRVVERLRAATLLEVTMETGFLHQVRATLAHLGHPLVGDATYAPESDAGPEGDPVAATPAAARPPAPAAARPPAPATARPPAPATARPPAPAAARHMLHASEIAFEEIRAASPDPDDFTALLAALRVAS